jgi:hypothetical protein
MKKSNLLMTLVMCLMSVSLFAAPAVGDDDVNVLRVFTPEEVVEMSVGMTDFTEVTSIRLIEVEGEQLLEVKGIDAITGEETTATKAGGFELLPCGSCPLFKKEGQWLIIFGGGEYCIQCADENAPGPN